MPGHPEAFRLLPSVDRVLRQLEQQGVLRQFSRRAATLCVREVLDAARHRLRAGQPAGDLPHVADEVEACLHRRFGQSLRRAINATGIALHTNLGRAPLSEAAQAAVAEAMAGYSTLELDLGTGERGSRHAHVERILTTVTGAEAGIAVNNAASAVLLSLAALAAGRVVAVSRSELVEIGGSFRMPEVMQQSGARLKEVGTTNRTYLRDYEVAIDGGAAVLLKVHRSNFVQSGFVHDVSLKELVALGRPRRLPVVYDLGSGCLVDLSLAGLPQEPTVQAAVATGADLITFSGDKLLGGPQAGLIVGRQWAVDRCRGHPLARAARLGKLNLAALAATLGAYLDLQAAWKDIPVLAMLAQTRTTRRRRAHRLAKACSRVLGAAATVEVTDTEGEVGGGSLPGIPLPSCAITIRPTNATPQAWAARLRSGAVPVLAVIRDDALLLDVLALLPGDERRLLSAVAFLAPS